MENIILRIKVFRAIDDIHACERFVEGHTRVLKIFGITMITSAKTEWFSDPDTYVIMVEDETGEKVYGGARVQVARGTYQLPIEVALSKFDPSIHSLVKDLSVEGTGELCGLWNSREIAGLGIGSIYLGRVGVAIATQLNINTLFALCAPATVKNTQRVGFTLETRLGDNGEFNYPKEGLVATAVLLRDVPVLSSAEPNEREKIFELRKTPDQQKSELSVRGKAMEIIYNLSILNKGLKV